MAHFHQSSESTPIYLLTLTLLVYAQISMQTVALHRHYTCYAQIPIQVHTELRRNYYSSYAEEITQKLRVCVLESACSNHDS